ncbi:MAG: translation initiation factor IF-1 [Candidatus Liptonbacteria bacterium]|nr:translation initiation factor IF-1 [Candidatus Liptonbacteria bacterium]
MVPKSISPVNRQIGLVQEALPGLTFKVILESDQAILAYLGGKLKINRIRVLPGDRVLVEVSPDGRRGRIVRRL